MKNLSSTHFCCSFWEWYSNGVTLENRSPNSVICSRPRIAIELSPVDSAPDSVVEQMFSVVKWDLRSETRKREKVNNLWVINGMGSWDAWIWLQSLRCFTFVHAMDFGVSTAMFTESNVMYGKGICGWQEMNESPLLVVFAWDTLSDRYSFSRTRIHFFSLPKRRRNIEDILNVMKNVYMLNKKSLLQSPVITQLPSSLSFKMRIPLSCWEVILHHSFCLF